MVVRVALRGLNIRQSRGKWYVSIRQTGDSLVKGFVGSREDLDELLGSPDTLKQYGRLKTRDRRPLYVEGTLGELVRWFQEECPRWRPLSDATKEDYEKTFLYLEPEFDTMLDGIEQADIYEVRNLAAHEKWDRFADKVVSNLSTMFTEGRKVRRIASNPAAGVEKLYHADPNANHEWHAAEYQAAIAAAPRHILTPLLLARHQGFRGQTCKALSWSTYGADPQFGRCFNIVLRKNREAAWFPCAAEVRTHLDSLDRTSTSICTSGEGLPWKTEKTLQAAVSQFLSRLKAEGALRPGCTLHGLRTTYAADIKRRGHDDGEVADALGDRSKAMGAHYTRHVEKEASLVRIFGPKRVVQND